MFNNLLKITYNAQLIMLSWLLKSIIYFRGNMLTHSGPVSPNFNRRLKLNYRPIWLTFG